MANKKEKELENCKINVGDSKPKRQNFQKDNRKWMGEDYQRKNSRF